MPRPRPDNTARRVARAAAGALIAASLLVCGPLPVSQAAKYRRVPIEGTAYYVSPSGSDSASGRSPAHAWRTVRQANRAQLRPGDGILFRAGATFSDDFLVPPRSGRVGAPLVYGSYGRGRAQLPKGIWFKHRDDLAFQRLDIRGAEQGVNGTGNRIIVQGSKITNTGIAINAWGSRWLIRYNVVDDTADSGLVLQGTRHAVKRNRITDTGRDPSIPYGKHGIYMKSSHTTVTRNVIRRFSDNGVSSRLRGGVVSRNVISGGEIGIAWFQNDFRAGVSRWMANRISWVSKAGLYVSPSDSHGGTIERFVISGNVVSRSHGSFIDLDTSRARTRVGCNTLRRGSSSRRVCSAAATARTN